MAVTVQTYSLTATWTAAQHATVWRSMLIDAGLMTEWYDSVTNGSYEHRILRLANNAAKTYGYQYIWLVFASANVYVQFATGWNASTHVPTGTQYYDYVATSCGTNATGFNTLMTLSTGSNYTYVRYTSGDVTYIGGPCSIVIKKTIGTVPSWLDLDKTAAFTFFNLLTDNAGAYSGGWRAMGFTFPFQIRRMLFGGRAFAGTYDARVITSGYVYGGVTTSSDYNDPSGTSSNWAGAVRLPAFSSTINAAYSSNYTPIITGIDLFPLLDCGMGSDFGFVTTLGATPAVRDLISVTAGVEVWEVIATVTAGSTNGMCLLARTI